MCEQNSFLKTSKPKTLPVNYLSASASHSCLVRWVLLNRLGQRLFNLLFNKCWHYVLVGTQFHGAIGLGCWCSWWWRRIRRNWRLVWSDRVRHTSVSSAIRWWRVGARVGHGRGAETTRILTRWFVGLVCDLWTSNFFSLLQHFLFGFFLLRFSHSFKHFFLVRLHVGEGAYLGQIHILPVA